MATQRRVTDRMAKELPGLLKQGASIVSIAKSWNVSRTSVYYWVNRSGIRKRKRRKYDKGGDYSYYHYVLQMLGRKEITNKEANSILKVNYREKKRYRDRQLV